MTRDWPSVAIRFFSWLAGIALLLAVVLPLRAAAVPGWRAAAAMAVGVGLLLAAELPMARSYRVTANALQAAGIGMLYATLYATHTRWHLISLPVVFLAMAVVTGAAVYLATRRASLFIALLGLIGGFVTAALLSSSESYPLPAFSYLLLLHIGTCWIALRQGWPWLMALGVVATAIYQWAWVIQPLRVGELLLAVAIFAVFAIVGTSPLWPVWPAGRPLALRRIGAGAAVMPLLFAVYVAGQSNYGPQYAILFGFLLLVDAGLLLLVWRGSPRWLHAASGVATLLTFLLWLRFSYTDASWPWPLLWLALFMALYLLRATPFSALLFFVFIDLGLREPHRYAWLIGTMLVLLATVLVPTIRRGRAILGSVAIGLVSAALMTLHPPLGLLLAVHAVLFAALFAVAWILDRQVVAVLAVPFYVAMVITSSSGLEWSYSNASRSVAIASVPCLLFFAYPMTLSTRAKGSLAPYVAATLASLVLFLTAWSVRGEVSPERRWMIGVVPLLEAAAMLVPLWRMRAIGPREPRLTLVASSVLALFNLAVPILLPIQGAVVVWAIEVAALSWLFTLVAHGALLVWSVGLAAAAFLAFGFDGGLVTFWWAYALAGVAMFAAAYFARRDIPVLQHALSVAGLFELWFLLNVSIANWFHSANGALNLDFLSSRAAEVAAYTVAWAVIATGLLIIGFLIDWPAARGAALALLVATVVKCFLNDVAHMAGIYLVVSLVGVGLSLVVVGIVLQKFVGSKAAGIGTAELPA